MERNARGVHHGPRVRGAQPACVIGRPGDQRLGFRQGAAVRETGTVYVTQITPAGLKVLATNEMKDRIAATPVPIHNKLLLRGMKYLYCIGK